jgi:hypothetical protein
MEERGEQRRGDEETRGDESRIERGGGEVR